MFTAILLFVSGLFCGRLSRYIHTGDCSESAINATQSTTETLIESLRQFQRQNNRLPDKLSEIGAFSNPAFGDGYWRYERNGGEFSLIVSGSAANYPLMKYLSGENKWIVDQ